MTDRNATGGVDGRVYAVLMAGGRGERFWPLSRAHRPKQLLPVVGEVPLVQAVARRIEPWIPAERMFVICNQRHAAAIRELLPELPDGHVVGERVGRDTAPCVAAAAALVRNLDPDGIMMLLPADQVIDGDAKFRNTLRDAARTAAETEALVTLGIRPAFPSTAYGYIEMGEPVDRDGDTSFYQAARFTEKPDADTARTFVDSGRFRWNSGIFVWRVAVILEEMTRSAPEVARVADRVGDAVAAGTPPEEAVDTAYADAPKISIDYAVMEHARSVLMADTAFGWDDVGEWPAVARHAPADDRGNVLRGLARQLGCENCIVVGDGGVATALGCSDLIVVHTCDATLVAPRAEAQRLKELIQILRDDEETRGFL